MKYDLKTGIPFKLNLPKFIKMYFSRHALEAARNELYGPIELEENLNTDGARVVEVETDERTGNPVKILLRKNYWKNLDVCYVISLERKVQDKFVVKTVWLNKIDYAKEKSNFYKNVDFNNPKEIKI